METKAAGISLMPLAKDAKVAPPGGAEVLSADGFSDPFAALLMQSVAALADPAAVKSLPGTAETKELKADKEQIDAVTALAAATDVVPTQAPLVAAVDMPILKSPFNVVPSDAKAPATHVQGLAEAPATAAPEAKRDAIIPATRASTSEKFAEVIQSLPREKNGESLAIAAESSQPDVPSTPNQSAVAIHAQMSSQALSSQPALPPSHAAAMLPAPVGTPAWNDALGQKVIWMASDQLSSAELTLNPPNLGPVEIKLSLTGDQANALFVAHQASVRDALDAAVPRLREMLADAGLTLANVSVGSESFQQSSPDSSQTQSHTARTAERDPRFLETSATPVTARRHNGMVDFFA